jgi:uncharacterized protein DUF4355
MADENTTATGQTAGEAGSSTNPETAGGSTATQGSTPHVGQNVGTQNTQSTQSERTFTQADLDRIVRERLAEARKRADKDAEDRKLAEQGEFQKLLEQEKARAADLEQQLKQRDHDALKARVAAKHKLPAELAERLRGETEEDLDKDAQALAKLSPWGHPAGGNAGAGSTSTTNPAAGRGGALTAETIKTMTPEQINANWDRVQEALKAGR